ncbi:MAG TPA: protein kinase [Candidatus Binataceae bacterium]|jgi:serine/threonine protein kinase/cell division septation protein DedD
MESIAGGRYRVRRILGEGGSKVVYLAHDERLARDVAVSLFRVEGLDDAGRARVLREARAMGRLGDHPHIVGIYDIGEAEQGRPYIVSQYVPGGSLSDLLRRAPGHRLPVSDTIRIAEQLCLAVEYAHSLGIVHRDIKPANVFLAGDGTPLLGDFGLAIAPDQSRITSHGMLVGTAAYLSPEQALARALEPRSDLYSLGALIYELLTGRPPFIGDDLMAIVSQHVNAVPEPPSKHAPGIFPALDALVLKLLAKTPAERPLSAAVVRETLHTIAGSSRGAMDLMASTVMVERPNLSGHAAPDGTVSIMFSDIENSTLIIERLGDLRAQEVFQIHNRAIREQVGKQGGYEVKSMGDGFMVAFSSARRALLCAVEIQQWLAAYSTQHPDAPLRVRIGLNTGEAIREAGDFFGKTVVLAARIGAAAGGGQILVSATFKAMTESAGDIRFGGGRDLNLKGLSGSYRVFEVLWAAPEKADKVIELPPDRAAPAGREPTPIPRAARGGREREGSLERDRFVFGEVRQPAPRSDDGRSTRRSDRRRRRLRIGLVVLLLVALSQGINRWRRYREENLGQQTVAPAQPGQTIPGPAPERSPESSPAAEPAPPMVVKPNTPNQGKVASTKTRSAPPPSLPRSKTTIISSEAPSGDESATESAPSAGEAPSQCVPTPHRYNIEVSAVSEKSEADAMVGRIAVLGFKACEKTRTVDGQTQYAVRIGPYKTADEAAAAQEKLHEQYKAAYSEP